MSTIIDNQLTQEEKSLINPYIQSYLKWLYSLNDDFAEVFSTSEIVNFYYSKVSLPLAINLLSKAKPYGTLIYIANFIEKNKDNDMAMVEITHKPIILDKALKNASKLKPVKEELMSDKQESFLAVKLGIFNKLNSTTFQLENKTEKLTKKDASLLINVLLNFISKKERIVNK